MDILANINNQANNIQQIENQLFTVIDYTVPTPNHIELGITDIEGVDIEKCEAQVIYTSDGRYFGQTKGQYTSIQPKDFFNTILESVHQYGHLDLEKLTYDEYKNGQIINFKLPTGMVTFKNRNGKQEEIELFLNFETGFAGLKATTIGLYSKRFICSNGLKIIESEDQLKARHTTANNAKVMLWTSEISKTIAKQKEIGTLWQTMDKIEVTKDQVQKFVNRLTKVDKNTKFSDLSTRKQNIVKQINDSIELEFARTGSTLFGLLQGITHYTNHVASGHSEEYINVATGLKLNNLAQEYLLKQLN